jgi:large repetitive protein
MNPLLQPLTTNESDLLTIFLTGKDLEGNKLNFALVNLPAFGTLSENITDINQTSARITYAPKSNFSGSDKFTFQVNDGVVNSNIASINITVNPVNDPPIANDDMVNTSEDAWVGIQVLNNDDDIDGDPLKIVGVTAAKDNRTKINITNDNTIIYVPAPNFFGTDTIGYNISDSSSIAGAKVLVNVTNVNDPPNAVDDTANTTEDRRVDIDVLANDYNVDVGDGKFINSTSSTRGNGNTTINQNGTITYSPSPNFSGKDSFNYTITVRNKGNDTGMVVVTVKEELAEIQKVLLPARTGASIDPVNKVTLTVDMTPSFIQEDSTVRFAGRLVNITTGDGIEGEVIFVVVQNKNDKTISAVESDDDERIMMDIMQLNLIKLVFVKGNTM